LTRFYTAINIDFNKNAKLPHHTGKAAREQG